MPRIGEDEVMIIGNCRSDKLAALWECGVESCVFVVGFYSKNTITRNYLFFYLA